MCRRFDPGPNHFWNSVVFLTKDDKKNNRLGPGKTRCSEKSSRTGTRPSLRQIDFGFDPESIRVHRGTRTAFFPDSGPAVRPTRTTSASAEAAKRVGLTVSQSHRNGADNAFRPSDRQLARQLQFDSL